MTCRLIIIFTVSGFWNKMFLSFCYLAMLNECCQKIKYKLVINLHLTTLRREGYITPAMFVSALRKQSLILIVLRRLKLLFIRHKLRISGWCQGWSSPNIQERLKNAEGSGLTLLASKWPAWPPPNRWSHHLPTICRERCPCLKGTIMLLTRFFTLIEQSDFRNSPFFQPSSSDFLGGDPWFDHLSKPHGGLSGMDLGSCKGTLSEAPWSPFHSELGLACGQRAWRTLPYAWSSSGLYNEAQAADWLQSQQNLTEKLNSSSGEVLQLWEGNFGDEKKEFGRI